MIDLAFAFSTPRDAKTCLLVLKGQVWGIDFGKLGWVVPTMIPVGLLRTPPNDVTYGVYCDTSWQRIDGDVQSVVVTGDRWPAMWSASRQAEHVLRIDDECISDEWSMSENDAHSVWSTSDSDVALSD